MICLHDLRVKGKCLKSVVFWLALLLHCPSLILADGNIAAISTLKDLFAGPVTADTLARVPAVATYVDPTWKTLFVQDETTGCLIRHPAPQWDISPGDRVLIEGYRTDPGATNPIQVLRNVTVRRLGAGQLPPARPANATDLNRREFMACRVEVQGTVRAIDELTRLKLSLRVGGKTFSAYVRQHQASDLTGLLDAEITLQAICNQESPAADGRPAETTLLVENFQAIRIQRPGPAQPFALPRTPIGQVTNRIAGQRALVRGRITGQKQSVSLSLQDESGNLLALSPLQRTLTVGDLVEAIGFPAQENGATLLKDVQFHVLESAGGPPAPPPAKSQTEPQLPVLTSIKQVLELSRDQARLECPLRVTGVVTRFDPVGKTFIIQDGEQAIFGGPISQTQALKPGQIIEVAGVTKPGDVLTMISPAKVTVLGEGAMPDAPLISFQTGMSGIFDCRRVKVQGVVQSAFWLDDFVNLDLVATDGRFWCTLPAPSDSPFRTNLLNAFVELEGVCIVSVDSLGGPSNMQIILQLEKDIRILQSAPTSEYKVRSMAIGDTLGFLLPSEAHHRLKIRGVATYWYPGRELYVQDATGAICVQTTDQTNRVELGDEVEVIGFRAMGESAPVLRNAEYQVVGKGQTPTAAFLRTREALNLANRGRLVQIEAKLREDAPPATAPELVLEDGPNLFTARLLPLPDGQLSPAWRAGSKLRVTGICMLRLDESRVPRAFRLLLRTPADVAVIETPSWFTTPRIVASALMLMAVVFVTLGWVAALRRQVSEQTEQILRRLESEAATERRLALVWEASADGMRMTDANGIVVQVNQAYCQMVKKTRGELENRPYWEALQTGDKKLLLADYQARFRSRVMAPWKEIALVLWNGEAKWFELSSRFIERAESSPLLLAQFRDITEHKLAEEEKTRLQEQLAQIHKTESIGRLAGGVAHDFNNMLQVILGNTILTLEELPPGSPLHEALLEVKNSAQRSADLTRQLLTFARKQTINPKVLDLNETVAAMLKMLQRLIGENIQLVWLPGKDLWPVKVDPAQIDQILVNLCVNARDAIVESGQITITTATARFDETLARTNPDCAPGEYVVLTVSDTGHGIDAATRNHLFEPFFTTKEMGKGTGLGLATVFGIVKQNRGFIEVHSEPNRGATFKICLPQSDAPAAPAPPRKQTRSLRGDETILLVEDEEQILNLGRRILSQYGYRVLAAQNPVAALKLAEQHPDPIQLLITDIIMPGMNGKELKLKIEALKPGIRCIFMSGYTADVIAHHGVMDEGIVFLQKPFAVDTLTRKVREVIEANAG
jgi:PAS domain S-box-containing protein